MFSGFFVFPDRRLRLGRYRGGRYFGGDQLGSGGDSEGNKTLKIGMYAAGNREVVVVVII